MRSRRRGGVCAANRLASQPKQGVSRDSIETDMIPIGDGNDAHNECRADENDH